MTTYVTIANTAIDQDSPGTQPLFTALRDNPIAIAEGDTLAPFIHGVPYLLERQEPTTDVSAIEFTTDISDGYGAVVVEIIFQALTNTSVPTVEVRATAGTWRAVATGAGSPTGTNFQTMRVIVTNVDNDDGTGVVRAYGIHGYSSVTTSFDRSSNNKSTNSGVIISGYSAFAETIAEIRFANTSTFEGSSADNRAIACLYGIKRSTRDV